MSVDMGRLFADGSVRRFFLNFPDPWFKSRQHKRRVIGPALMADVARALAPGGELFVQTDIFALALEAMAALEEAPAFVNVDGRLDVRAPQPLRREVAPRAPVRDRRLAHLAAALPARVAQLAQRPPSDSRISSRSLILSRRAAAFSNSSDLGQVEHLAPHRGDDLRQLLQRDVGLLRLLRRLRDVDEVVLRRPLQGLRSPSRWSSA